MNETAEQFELNRDPNTGLCDIFYIADNAAGTPIFIAQDVTPKRAKQIVRALNCHADLLEACELIQGVHGDVSHPLTCGLRQGGDKCTCSLSKVAAAITKARKGT